jgi:hypothetical protein
MGRQKNGNLSFGGEAPNHLLRMRKLFAIDRKLDTFRQEHSIFIADV